MGTNFFENCYHYNDDDDDVSVHVHNGMHIEVRGQFPTISSLSFSFIRALGMGTHKGTQAYVVSYHVRSLTELSCQSKAHLS